MWRRRSAVLALIMISASSLGASQAANATFRSTAAISDDVMIALLRESHDLDQQFTLSIRLNLLSHQARLISMAPGTAATELALEWANELFGLAAQAKEPQRSRVRGSALDIIARLHPDRALDVLGTAEFDDSTVPSPKLQLARRVFASVATAGGINVLPLLQQQAERMAAQGEYPYAALADAANDAVANEWRSNAPHAAEVLRSVFEPSFERFRQGSPNFPNDYEFGEMLRVLAGGLPFELIQPALRVWVKNLLAADTSKYHYQAHLLSQDGDDFHTDNSADAAIMWFGELINRDSELVAELEASRPELTAALECYRRDQCHSASFGYTHQRPTRDVTDPNEEARAAAVRQSYTNSDRAVNTVESLADDEKRVDTALDVARNIAGAHPEQATHLINESRHSDAGQDNQKQLNIISAQITVAAARNQQEELRQLLQHGFEAAASLVEQSTTSSAPSIPGLAPMIQIGIQNDPDLTVNFLNGLPPTRLKAELLLGAVEALQMPVKLPIGSAEHAPKPLPRN